MTPFLPPDLSTYAPETAVSTPDEPNFWDLGLKPALLETLLALGYESPTPIQAQTIPLLLSRKDMVGQAQTGTGKTAAFALPILNHLAIELRAPQALVLTPTRELAIQVAEAFQRYASRLKGFHVLPIYGGQGYDTQLRALKRGVHVLVATPGRLIDHLDRGTVDLSSLDTLVLDEADEMLRMGFIDDVEKILEQTPAARQTCLFSATMPREIRRLAQKYLKDPEEITIKVNTSTAQTIRQRYWFVRGVEKIDALTRLLESEPSDGVLVFVRTKTATVELADQLSARGHAASALNGDMAQNLRERTVEQLRQAKLDVLVATDVAARGLDIERVSHVINYDIPYDTESYIHRIGRTGRAGRSGEAILFVTPREKRLLWSIEKTVGQRIEPMELPTAGQINEQRIQRFKQNIGQIVSQHDTTFYRELLAGYAQETGTSVLEIASALALMAQGETPLLLPEEEDLPPAMPPRKARQGGRTDEGLVPFRVEVGRAHDLRPSQLVGAIANEAGLDSSWIGRIEMYEDFSTVDLPEAMQAHLSKALARTRINGQMLKLSRLSDSAVLPAKTGGKSARPFKKDFKKPYKSDKGYKADKDFKGEKDFKSDKDFKAKAGKPAKLPTMKAYERPKRKKDS
ncbi:MAG: DEAD/DEAH box helicase [Candidatus Sericytochromatia bacterium]